MKNGGSIIFCMENPDDDQCVSPEMKLALQDLEKARLAHSGHEGGGSPITKTILDDCIARCKALLPETHRKKSHQAS